MATPSLTKDENGNFIVKNSAEETVYVGADKTTATATYNDLLAQGDAGTKPEPTADEHANDEPQDDAA